ncbi:MAG: histidine phosphatase family protein [Weeksellaceae bacterium]|nr:histidine phosphatase family protein [Weeksellaceae bacterium]
MPKHIVFIRHGESEANVIQKRDKLGEDVTTQESLAIRERTDYKQRLSKQGVEQAIQAREWINKNICDVGKFDSYFVSSFFRARETAANISTNNPEVKWEIDDRLAERNWGVHGPLTISERKEFYEITDKLMNRDPFHASFEGGESIWGVKNERIRNIMNTWAREQDGKKILVVTHGDLIRAARVGFERILPEEFEAIELNPVYKVKNCQILEYSRVNPFTGQDEGKIKWRRITNPTEPETSPDNGNWIELQGKPKMSSNEIIEKIEKDAPNLIRE